MQCDATHGWMFYLFTYNMSNYGTFWTQMKHGVLSIGVVQIDFHEHTNSDNSDDSAGSSLTFTQRLHSLRMAQMLTTNQCAGGVNGLSELGNLWLSNHMFRNTFPMRDNWIIPLSLGDQG